MSSNEPDNIYINPKEDYIKGLKTGEKGRERILITTENDALSGGIETSKMAFSDFAFYSVQRSCTADGPGPLGWTSVSCDKVVKQSKFLNKYGLDVYELYINSTRNDHKGDENKTVGPIFVLDVSRKTRITRALVVAGSFFEPLSGEDEKIIREVVDYLRF
ncbi:MAG: hypothetical protein AAB583_04945 [Patescibacteria group bacterium]